MESSQQKRSINTVTGVFATREDAENAYQSLLHLGYKADEITLIMAEETFDKLYDRKVNRFQHSPARKKLQVTRISEALDVLGRFVAIPGLALVVATDFAKGGARALSSSVLSENYAEYFQNRLLHGEILIDFSLHTAREKNLIVHQWEDFGGYPLIRRISNAA
ncbi:hypothetical protein [Dyadobacter aurulentus]|uniref:hypothetical protein n=1 Tax=Dyadobacter sp. UC 10 TaxID=2605428 RepID=UPI0011F0AA55|nr:hypothetical protein [Dyadobacter sp. UC 10]KAA0992581.1 hypothetical protein FXO21_21605 [Dyadobacter sp. UC 10]